MVEKKQQEKKKELLLNPSTSEKTSQLPQEQQWKTNAKDWQKD